MSDKPRWYQGVTGYQWLVLVIASLGWIFDVFEGQILVTSMDRVMPSLLKAEPGDPLVHLFNDRAFAAFLAGGALGGVVFGILGDRIGRARTMILTILVYSFFTCATAFARDPWHVVILRFFVALGTGGEWAVASALVAEVFPIRSRAWSLAIFHGSSVLGTYLAVVVGKLVVNDPALGWRWAFAVGAVPALLTLWIRWRVREPESWVQARQAAREGRTKPAGRIGDLFGYAFGRRTLVGLGLATIGLATFWGVHIYGKDLMKRSAERRVLRSLGPDAPEEARRTALRENDRSIKDTELVGMFLTTTGGGLGLLAFGPLCERLGRRGAFLFYHAGAIAATLLLFGAFREPEGAVLWIGLPVFGFLSLGMHAGYAVYFPELFPTRLRGTGAGFCFNGGRLLASSIILLRGQLLNVHGFSLNEVVCTLASLYVLGALLLLAAPETKGKELPE